MSKIHYKIDERLERERIMIMAKRMPMVGECLRSITIPQAIAFAKQEIKEWQKFIKELSNKKK